MAQVLNFLRAWGPTDSLSLRQLLQCNFALVLIFSCRQISDLCLLGCKEPLRVISPSMVSLQFAFGLKQDRPNQRSPPIVLQSAPDAELCPVHHVRQLLKVSAPFALLTPSLSRWSLRTGQLRGSPSANHLW